MRPKPGRAPHPAPARERRSHLGAIALLALLVLLAPGAAHAAVAAPANLAAADALAGTPPSAARDASLIAWAKRADLRELVFVLRRAPVELDRAEAPLVEAALARAPRGRGALRRRLIVRLALAQPARAKKLLGELEADAYLRASVRPHASVFRVAALLPDTGDYVSYARAVRAGLVAGISSRRPSNGLPIELVAFGTGDDRADIAGWRLDDAADRCGIMVGELLSVPTYALATGARMLGLPLVSPTATDESVGAIGPQVFQVGPSGWLRGKRLAHAVLADGRHRIALVISSASVEAPFVRGFTTAAESLGSTVVRRDQYAAGGLTFSAISRAIKTSGADLLFWDGEAREADALVRQLAKDAVAIRLCGGSALAPDQFHPVSRPLFDGVQYSSDDWQLAPAAAAIVDSLARAKGLEREAGLLVKGWLAGRRIAAAVDAGALCPEEVVSALAAATYREPELRGRGFLEFGAEVSLPVYTITRGRPVEMK